MHGSGAQRRWLSELAELTAWLKQAASSNILIPLASKRPKYAHSNGQWTWDDWDRWLASRTSLESEAGNGSGNGNNQNGSADHLAVGVLMRDMLCLDVDDHALCDWLRRERPSWFDPPPVEAITRKGRHFIWSRQTGEYASTLTDRARSLVATCVPEAFLDVNGEVPIDIKTVTSTGTAGLLVVSPSPGKEWVRSPWQVSDAISGHGSPVALPEVPDDLMDWLEASQKPRSSAMRAQARAQQQHNAKDWDLPIEMAVAISLAYELLNSRLGDGDSRYYQQKQNGLYFKTKPERRTTSELNPTGGRCCPYGRRHDSNNFALVYRKDGSVMYWCFGSACQEQYSSAAFEVGRWMAVADIPHHPRFDEAWYNKQSAAWQREMDMKPEHRDYDVIREVTDKLIPYLNRFFIVVKSSKPEIVELTYTSGSDRLSSFTRRSVQQHQQLYKNKRFMLAAWMAHEDRRRVDRLVFEMDDRKVGHHDFNMFLGLKVERQLQDERTSNPQPNMARLAPILELLHDVWAGGDEYIYDYILKWFAFPLQRKRKTGVCLVVISEQGYGKGSIAHDLVGCGIYGEVKYDAQDGCYTQITDIEDIVGKFNSQSCNRLFINADECSSFGGAYKQNNKLKSLITAESRKLEAKGLDGVTVSDHANYLMTTNNDDPVRVETSDRRFVVLDIDRTLKKSSEFFDLLHAVIADGAATDFYLHLMALTLADFNPQHHRPITSAARQMMAGQVPPPLAFIQHCADTKRLYLVGCADNLNAFNQALAWDRPMKVKSASLYAGFVAWATQGGVERKYDAGQFSKVLVKHVDIKCARGEDGQRAMEVPSVSAVIHCLKAGRFYVD